MAPQTVQQDSCDTLLSPSRRLAIEGVPDGFTGSEQLGSPCSPEKSPRFERAGAAFERKARGLYSGVQVEPLEDDDEAGSAVENVAATWEDEPKKKKRYKKDADGNDVEIKDPPKCYKLLNLEHLMIKATEDDIKAAFRKLSLQLHPDKAAQNGLDAEVAQERFKLVQEAYEILIDKHERQKFDSIMPAKYDRIPSADDDGEFFETYGPAFERYSRWSEVVPCPLLGDANTPMEEVDAFYDFWYNFKSWRIILPDGGDEHNEDDAEDTYERRWMRVENERERKKLKKEHMKLIATLRDQAFKLDPRVLAAKAREHKEREEIKAQKIREKEEKAAAARALEDKGKSAKQLAREAELREQAEAASKKAAEQQKLKDDAAAAEQEQAAKIQAAILARQRKLKEKKSEDKKKPKKKK